MLRSVLAPAARPARALRAVVARVTQIQSEHSRHFSRAMSSGADGAGDDASRRAAPGATVAPTAGGAAASEAADFAARADWEHFRRHGHELVDFIADYYQTVRDRPVRSQVAPGYLRPQLPDEAPEEAESMQAVLADVQSKIMPGITHWQHPAFFAYFSANSTWPGLCGEMLSGMFNVIGFSWIASPAASELETVVMDWLGKLVGLPPAFLSASALGGGVIQGTASEATLVALLAARARALDRARAAAAAAGADTSQTALLSGPGARLVAYASDQAHSSVHKAAMIAGTGDDAVHFRALPTAGPAHTLDGGALRAAVREDLAAGRVPFFCCATLGTTGIGACDPLQEVGAVCREHGLWMHVDAAWAGNALVCPEHRGMLRGVELADSLGLNPHKWLLTNFDCSAMWVQDRTWLLQALSLTPEYLRSRQYDAGLVQDYRDWQVPLGRRFRALKLWMVLRLFGASGLRAHIRASVALAQRFEAHVLADARFALVTPRVLGLVCFRARALDDDAQLRLLERVNDSGASFLVHTKLEGRVVLRMATGNPQSTGADVDRAWQALVGALEAEERALEERRRASQEGEASK